MTDKATPVQVGIDPLVAEIVERLASHMGQQAVPVLLQDCRQAAALLRSQAERIAALEVERDDYKSDYLRRHKDVVVMMERAIAAESLLAEAREALEPFAERAERYNDNNTIRINDDVELWQIADNSGMSLRDLALTVGDLRHARATLSRLKPGEKGGGE